MSLNLKTHNISLIYVLCFIVILNFIFGALIIIIVQQVVEKDVYLTFDRGSLPDSALSIFINNVKFSAIFALPYFGLVYYIVSCIYLYIIIGLYHKEFGFYYVISKLPHLPLEIIGLSIPIVVSLNFKRMEHKEIMIYIFCSALILFFSAFLEYSVI